MSDELWEAVQARQAIFQKLYGGQRPGLLNRAAKGGNLLTGFLKCGVCGANLVIVTGRRRRYAMYGCPQHYYRGACTNRLKMRQEDLEQQLLSELQRAVLQPEAIDYTLREFERQLASARARSAQDRERVVAREKELQDQLQRLTAAVAESGHSPVLLRAIAEREQELVEIGRLASSDDDASHKNAGDFRQLITERLSRLPELLSMDVMRARAELARHVTHITMTPSAGNGALYYACQGDWNLLGIPGNPGDVRMVAGGGFDLIRGTENTQLIDSTTSQKRQKR